MNVYESIIQGLDEAIAYAKGNCHEAKVHKISVKPVPSFSVEEIKMIRSGLGMTQAVFAFVLGVSPRTVEAWERGTNKPNGPSCRLLKLYQDNPHNAQSLVAEN